MLPGQGSHGFQRGRGRGGGRFLKASRGRGRGAASKKWVRPTGGGTQSSISSETKETSEKGEMSTRENNDSKQSTKREEKDVPAATSTKQSKVVLKGPKRYPKVSSKSHTWKRPKDASENAAVTKVAQDSKVEASASVAVAPERHHNNEQSTTKPSAAESASMVRRGRRQLVSQKQDESESNVATAMPPLHNREQSDVGDGSTTTSTTPMKKRGRNKLVLAKTEGGDSLLEGAKKPSLQVEQSLKEENSFDGHKQQQGDSNHHPVHARKGNNKLVLQDGSSMNDLKVKRDNRHMGSVQSRRGRGGGRGKRIAAGHRGVKRIKLNPSEAEDASVGVQGGNETGSGTETEGHPHVSAGEKYTEFAYRQSSAVSQRGRARSMRGRGGAGKARGRNMGLVRVEPDSATTRMCPVYLRGEPCMNPNCTKRHDVPKEASIPICSFFQRNGQCNKGDACQFRHIKVNPNATVCPSFSLLGFCENKECVMKHVRAPKKK